MTHCPRIPQSRLARWNRRQRKKLRAGEFQELGFELALKFSSPLDAPAHDHFLAAFCDYIEPIDLCAGGLGGPDPVAETDDFLSTVERGTVTPEQRAAVMAWCQARPEVAVVRAGELVDAWHGWGQA